MPTSSCHNINGLHTTCYRLFPRSIGKNRDRGVALDDVCHGLAIIIGGVGEANGVFLAHCGGILGDSRSKRNRNRCFVPGRADSGDSRKSSYINTRYGQSRNESLRLPDLSLF